MAAFAAAVVGFASITVFTIQTIMAAPAPLPPPKPMGVLPEVADAAAKVADLKALTGLVFPGDWKLVSVQSNSKVEGNGSKAWVFMTSKSGGGASKLEALKSLVAKPMASAPPAGVSEALALDLNRLSVGKPIAASSSPLCDAPGGGSMRLDLLELEEVLVARATWLERR